MFRGHVLACCITDPSGLLLADRIGIDNIAWECDHPHRHDIAGVARAGCGELQDAACAPEEVHKITWENASRFFGGDPFAKTLSWMPRSQRGARAEAADVDTPRKPRAESKKQNEAPGILA